MELRRENIIAGDGGGKVVGRVAGRGRLEPGVGGLAVVAVHEIEAAAVGDALPERVRGALPHLVPSHVRDLHAGPRREPAHLPRQQPQPRGVALGAPLEEHLLADAKPEEGLFAGARDDRLGEPALVQHAHAVGHRPLAREDDAVGPEDRLGIGGDRHLGAGRHVLEGLVHRAQVAHAVVDDGNALGHGTRYEARGARNGPYRLPLVEGTVPAARGSGSTAMRSARAKALNTVSHWWWALSPRRLSICTVACA